MNVPDDKAVPEGLHGIAEDIMDDGLTDILHEFQSVGFNAFSLFCRAHAFIGDGFSAKLIHSDTREALQRKRLCLK